MNNPLLRPAACFAVAIMLLIAILPVSESYKFALGVVVFVVALMEIVFAWRTGKWDGGKPYWIAAFIGLTVAFNPIFPMEKSREVWIGAYVYGAFLFGWAAVAHVRRLRAEAQKRALSQ